MTEVEGRSCSLAYHTGRSAHQEDAAEPFQAHCVSPMETKNFFRSQPQRLSRRTLVGEVVRNAVVGSHVHGMSHCRFPLKADKCHAN